ncbi:hypothetical protein UlMin_039931 [Ulmus minor]
MDKFHYLSKKINNLREFDLDASSSDSSDFSAFEGTTMASITCKTNANKNKFELRSRKRTSNGTQEEGSSRKKMKKIDDLDTMGKRKALRDIGCKQFWKAGDYEGDIDDTNSPSRYVGMDHARVHPRFLHSNATSHKWALGAFAELLDNSLDEVCNGATYVNIDILQNQIDGSKMLLVEDDGGGMSPDKMRRCMSLGYSAKSKLANTIGQYGNGFKTSTMRLGADVIVFSRCQGTNGKKPTQTIGMLSYTFLRGTRKEDIVVPMIDYDTSYRDCKRLERTSMDDWKRNFATITEWSPYSSEKDLLKEFDNMKEHGTRIIIYNLWEDDGGQLELDFDADSHDIQIRGVKRDEKNIKMAKQYPNARHFFTYRHSLRSYASILYLRLPTDFRIIIRGKDVKHHNIVDDMMLTELMTYKPMLVQEGKPKGSPVVVDVTIGFVKDAKHHIDVQGFNVYHKNRLIKPFWRVWNAAGSDGRGAIGVLEANFVEPAHDKQGFERTIGLSRLEARLILMQKNYWFSNCHKVGYAARRVIDSSNKLSASDNEQSTRAANTKSIKRASLQTDKSADELSHEKSRPSTFKTNTKLKIKLERRSAQVSGNSKDESWDDRLNSSMEPQEDSASKEIPCQMKKGSNVKVTPKTSGDGQASAECNTNNLNKPKILKWYSRRKRNDSNVKVTSNNNGDEPGSAYCNTNNLIVSKEKNCDARSMENGEAKMAVLVNDLHKEREKNKTLEDEVTQLKARLQEMAIEQTAMIDLFEQDRKQLMTNLKKSNKTIEELRQKVRLLEEKNLVACKIEKP